MRNVSLLAVCFMCFVLSVVAVNALAQTGGFAPADQRAFNSLVAGKRILADDGGDGSVDAYYDFGENGRFTANDGVLTLRGTILYTRTGPNASTLRHDVDGVGIVQCSIGMNFSSRNHGTWQWGSGCSYSGTGTWRLEGADTTPDFGSRDIGYLRFVENQAIAPLTLPEADSGDAPLTYEIQPALPAGLTFNSGTRLLSGTPTAPAARRTYTYTATDADGDSASLTFTITVAAEMTSTVPDFGSRDIGNLRFVRNQAVTPLTLPEADSGDAPLTYEIQPALPAGLTFNSATRVLSGTPTTPAARSTYTYTVTDADGDSASLAFTITVAGEVVEPADPDYVVPLFTSASASQQGFARIINHSDTSGTVRIFGTDDMGKRFPPIDLSLDPKETAHFNSQDLEAGNVSKGLSEGLGDGEGNWRLVLDTGLDIEVSVYIRTVDGFLTSIHDVARTLDDGRHHVPFFNPASNPHQRSELRLLNLGDASVRVTIEGRDDDGEEPAGEVRLTLGAGQARLLNAQELETGGSGFSGNLGDGAGKWQLFVTADGPIQVMSLLQSPTGHLTNLSRSGLRSEVSAPGSGPTGTAAELTNCDVSISSLTLENVCTPPLEQRGTPESGTVEEVVQRHTDQGYISLPAPLLTYGLLFDTHVPLQLLPVADERRLRDLLQERVDEGCEFIARQDAIVTGRFAFVCPSTAPPVPARGIPLFTSASASQQGFARIINHSDTSGTVEIRGIDAAGDAHRANLPSLITGVEPDG